MINETTRRRLADLTEKCESLAANGSAIRLVGGEPPRWNMVFAVFFQVPPRRELFLLLMEKPLRGCRFAACVCVNSPQIH